MSQPAAPASVDVYVGLELAAYRDELLSGIPVEAAQQSIELSGAHDREMASAGLTPHAVQWFNQRIAPSRASALAEIAGDARAIRIDGDDVGSFGQFDLDSADRTRAVRLREVTEEFAQKNSRLMADHQERERNYRRHRNEEGGRDAKVPSHWLEFAGLLPLVMIPEALMNFQSFRMAPIIQSDFMALGVTLLIAIGIAVSAHFFGLFLRQNSYFRRGDDQIRHRSSLPRLGISLVLLIVCLTVVAAARYYYLVPQVQQASVLGIAPPNMFFSVASLLGGNLLCFLLGAAFAWALHDDNPEYEASARALKNLRKQLERAKRRDLDKKVDEINKRLASERTIIEKKTRTMQAQAGHGHLIGRLEQVKAKDQEVISALQEYRKLLGQALQGQRPGFEFIVREYSGDPTQIRRPVAISEFMNNPIRLHYAQG